MGKNKRNSYGRSKPLPYGDRLSRSLVDFASMWQVLDTYNVEFVSVSEKFDTTTPMGRAMIYIIMVFAQLERENIRERTSMGMKERIKKKDFFFIL